MKDQIDKAKRLLQAGNTDLAMKILLAVCAKDETQLEAWFGLGMIHGMRGEFAEAADCMHKVVTVQKDNREALHRLGTALQSQGKYKESIEFISRLISLDPGSASGHFQLALTYISLARLTEAAHCLEEAIRLNPGNADAFNSLGVVQKSLGDLTGAINSYKHAIRLDPGHKIAASNYLFALNYIHAMEPESVFDEHLQWGRHLESCAGHPEPAIKAGGVRKKLRIGYVSPDLHRHSVAFFLEPILEHHDKNEFDIYCYSDTGKCDDMTERLKARSGHWRDTRSMNDRRLSAQIRDDGIDILVDLAGHTSGNRLSMFAMKPAPIQVTYLGYPNTTGLTRMDYRITDALADPPGLTEHLHTETLIRLEHGFLCYRPDPESPPVATPPVLQTGSITFGSFNNLAKMTDTVISIWSLLLKRIDNSRLLIKNISLSDEIARNKLLENFKKHDVDADRLVLMAPRYSSSDHLEVYNQIDIALDTFPYNGTTTTCEALWMGVPVICCTGGMHASNVGSSILHRLDLGHLVTTGPDDYIDTAVSIARDHKALSVLRSELRERMRHSPLCDGNRISQELEAAFRDAWINRCSNT